MAGSNNSINGKRAAFNGDSTTTGAKCIASSTWSVNGKASLRVGDKTTPCPLCGKTGIITTGDPTRTLNGITATIDGSAVLCGCPPGTNKVVASGGYVATKTTEAPAQTEPAQHAQTAHRHPEPEALPDTCACNRDITLAELATIAPHADRATLSEYLPAFNEGFRSFSMNTCREKAHFLAQCCCESMGLTRTKEINGEHKDYAPWYGRGLIQLTFENSYKKYGEYIHHDFISNEAEREKVIKSPHCVKSAFWFYVIHDNMNLNKYAKLDDFNMITARVNGGFNGYNERLRYFHIAVKTLKAQHLAILEKNGAFTFEDSEIYNMRIYAYSWARYHDPHSKEQGTDKNKNEALKAYKRALPLYEKRSDKESLNIAENIKLRISHLK